MKQVTINFVFVDGELGSMTVPDYVWNDFLMGIAKDARCFRRGEVIKSEDGNGNKESKMDATQP
jgi:hypothetical protein